MSDTQLPPQPTNEKRTQERTRIQDIPEIKNLQVALIDNGFGELVRISDAHLEIDTAQMKHIAKDLYGISKDRIVGHGRIPTAIEDLATDAHDTMLTTVENSWEGDAYDAFARFSTELRNVTVREADRARVIGDALFNVAEAIEQGAEDIKATYLGAAGMLMTAKSFFPVSASVPGVVVVAAEALLSVYVEIKQRTDAAARTAASETESTISISRPKVMTETPRDALSKYRYPKDPTKWQIEED